MREIEQIVVDQLIIRCVIQVSRADVPIRVGSGDRFGDLGDISSRGVAHPDPDPASAFDHRIAADDGLRGDHRLARDLGAAAIRPELQAVIHAAKIVAFPPAQRQRREAVTAAVLHCDNDAIAGSI